MSVGIIHGFLSNLTWYEMIRPWAATGISTFLPCPSHTTVDDNHIGSKWLKTFFTFRHYPIGCSFLDVQKQTRLPKSQQQKHVLAEPLSLGPSQQNKLKSRRRWFFCWMARSWIMVAMNREDRMICLSNCINRDSCGMISIRG